MTTAVMSLNTRKIITHARSKQALANWYVLAGLDPRRLVHVDELADGCLIFYQN